MCSSFTNSDSPPVDCPATLGIVPTEQWSTFADMLNRLHREHIYLHPHQLAEFLVFHGLPVDLCYVPSHLQQKAQRINDHYQGDMARLEARPAAPQLFPFE